MRRAVIGWSLYDFANSAFATTILAVIFNRYYAGVVAGGESGTIIAGIVVPGASLFSFAVSLSMVIVAVMAPVLGALADYSKRRKRFFFMFFLMGVIFTGCLASVGPGAWLWGGFCFVLANVGFAAGNVFYNAFLVDISTPATMGRISGLGWGVGYLGGGLLLILNLIMLKYPELIGFATGTFTVRHCFFSVALWWGLFSIPTFLWLPADQMRTGCETARNMIAIGFSRIRETMVHLRRYRQLVRFLMAYLIYNDGIQTIIVLASIFGAQELQMEDGELIFFFLMIQGTAFVGALVMGWLADRNGNKSTIILCLIVWSCITVWAYFLGFTGSPIREYWLLGVCAGLVMGGSQSASRSLAGMMTPPDRATEFFGFYAIAGKFASIFGPLIYGLIVLVTDSLRTGILSLIAFFIIGLLVMITVDETANHTNDR